MRIYTSEQLVCCLALFVYGAAVGLFYCVFRFLRVMLGVRKRADSSVRSVMTFGERTVLFFTDFVFAVSVSVFYCIMLYCYSYGKPRLFAFLCAVFGYILFYVILGKRLGGLFESLALLVRKLSVTLFGIIAFPLKTALKYFLRFVCFSWDISLGRICRTLSRAARRRKVYSVINGQLPNNVRF